MFYSGKKKRHTVKNISIVDENGCTIYLSPTLSGSVHDKRVADLEGISWLEGDATVLADLGFQGLNFVNEKISLRLPIKKKPNKDLSEKEKIENKKLASQRVSVEHSFSRTKQFRICSQVSRLQDILIRDAVMWLATSLNNFKLSRGIHASLSSVRSL